eukprot:1049386-Amphidinium_carterae.1
MADLNLCTQDVADFKCVGLHGASPCLEKDEYRQHCYLQALDRCRIVLCNTMLEHENSHTWTHSGTPATAQIDYVGCSATALAARTLVATVHADFLACTRKSDHNLIYASFRLPCSKIGKERAIAGRVRKFANKDQELAFGLHLHLAYSPPPLSPETRTTAKLRRTCSNEYQDP